MKTLVRGNNEDTSNEPTMVEKETKLRKRKLKYTKDQLWLSQKTKCIIAQENALVIPVNQSSTIQRKQSWQTSFQYNG